MSILVKLKGYRTVLVNAVALLGVITAALADVPLDGDTSTALVAGIAAANIILRAVTNSPLFKRR